MPRRSRSNPYRSKPEDGRRKNKITPKMAAKKWQPGQSGNPGGRPKGKTLLSRIHELMKTRSQDPEVKGTRFDVVANAYVKAMEVGSFQHLKEFIDREEGRVPQKLETEDGKSIKLFVGIPVEGEGAP